MHFDLNTLEGRHLVLAYASVILIQGGYALWLLRNWMKVSKEQEKATKPVA